MVNQNRIPFIPKLSADFKPMQYVYCKDSETTPTISQAAFLRLLKQQSCPMAQVNIDFEGGIVYLFPYCEEQAQCFIQLNKEFEREYKRYWRYQQAIRTGKRQTALSLDFEVDEEGTRILDTIASDDTPESIYLSREENDSRRAAFVSLTEADQEFLLGYISARGNARELARCLGKDPSGVSKRMNRIIERLKKKVEKNF